MRINDKTKQYVEFEKLSNGDVFLMDESLYMRIADADSDCLTFNAVRLSNGAICSFSDNSYVEKLDVEFDMH